jgi:glycosyltransferase involved in cell wall biosynthesis
MRLTHRPNPSVRRLLGGLRSLLRIEANAPYSDRRTLDAMLARHGVEPGQGGDARRARAVWAERPDVREAFPLGLTPAGRGPYFEWLLTGGKADCGLTGDDIRAFAAELTADTSRGLATTYRLTPEWQERFPHALTRPGWRDLRRWLRSRYGLAARWLNGARRPRAPARTQPGLNMLTHFRYPSGIQQQARYTLDALRAAGVPVALRDVPAGVPGTVDDPFDFLDPERHDFTLLSCALQTTPQACYAAAALYPRPGVYRFAQFWWELETVPADRRPDTRMIHEVWAPTRFVADALRPVVPVPVTPMLGGVDLPAVPGLPRCRLGLPEGRFLFLFCFDMFSVMERKNPLGLIRSFRRAFRPDEGAALVVKVSRGPADPAERGRLLGAAGEAGVTVIDAVLPREDSLALLAACDCYVSLHRSEGFGLSLAEAMLLGKPVVATGYSGNLDFMSADNSLLVDARRVPLERDYPPYPRGAAWAEPSEDHAARLMRWAFDHPEEAKALGERARRDAQERLSPAAAGGRMRRRLEAVRAARGGAR